METVNFDEENQRIQKNDWKKIKSRSKTIQKMTNFLCSQTEEMADITTDNLSNLSLSCPTRS